MAEDRDATYFENPTAWRAWLEVNHASADFVWLGYWKKHTGRVNLTWSEAVDHALCFGWIDSVRQSVDADRSRQRFTPRRRGSTWSNVNVEKVARLEALGRYLWCGSCGPSRGAPDGEAVLVADAGGR